jgi:riboflavin kinase/FMN adenylyltransferase
MTRQTVLTIGNFDGVHLGHRAILDRARLLADEHDATLRVLAFDPHPATILRPGTQPPRLMTTAQKLAALHAAGADDVVTLQPTRELLGLTPEQFVAQVVDVHRPVAVVEGNDFQFGKDRAGTMDTLQSLGISHGFAVHVVAPVAAALHDQLLAPVRSSLVRWLIEQGRVADVALCLTQPLTIMAPVARGEQRGRTIDVPTANLDAAALAGHALPADAVYAGYATLADGTRHVAAISIGVKPTFGRHERVVEAHLLDFKGDLYGQRIALSFTRWLREQQRFPSADALKTQLHRDIAAVRDWHARGLLSTVRHSTPLAATKG